MKLKIILFVSLSFVVFSLLACNLVVQKTGMADGGEPAPTPTSKKCICNDAFSDEDLELMKEDPEIVDRINDMEGCSSCSITSVSQTIADNCKFKDKKCVGDCTSTVGFSYYCSCTEASGTLNDKYSLGCKLNEPKPPPTPIPK